MPSVGRVVLVRQAHMTEDCPGIVTKAHSQNVVNLTMFPDGGLPSPQFSVEYAEDPAGHGISWHWMDYQLKVASERDPVTGDAAT